MTEEDVQPRWRRRNVLWLVLAAVILVLAALLIPPYISISRYKSSITELMSRSLGRPVRLSSVELRLLPWPGFVLTDLTVAEDPAYGAEPVLHANTVKASIRLLSLWRGRLEIDSISVDEASLNLVRSSNGVWNLDPLFRTAAAHVKSAAASAPSARTVRLPYLEATNSRVNFKNGLEKLPFSLVDADLSLWQDEPGVWRVRLKGQPARTDVTLDLADTGLVRMEAVLHSAPELRQMPIRVDVQWREAQLGQLSRLLIGSDPGWRGDLTWQLHVGGTPDSAQVTTRLSATGVHRAEFAPADPLDFDANCKFDYHYSMRKVEGLSCDSPLGDGRMHLEGDLPGNAPPDLILSLDHISAQAGLDLLRTVRSGIPDSLEAHGSISGRLKYDPTSSAMTGGAEKKIARPGKALETLPQILTGSFEVAGFSVSGGPLDEPLQFSDCKLEPRIGSDSLSTSLEGSTTIAAGGSTPLSATVRIGRSRFVLNVQGLASYKRLQEFAQLAGVGEASEFGRFSGNPAVLNLSAEGSWIPPEEKPLMTVPVEGGIGASDGTQAERPDQFFLGTITAHKAVWKPDQLANPVELESATLRLNPSDAEWEGEFAYGPLNGTAVVHKALRCDGGERCAPLVALRFEQLDAQVLQTALLGAHDKKTLLSSLLAQFTTAKPAAWPEADVTLNAGTLALGEVKLQKAALSLAIHAESAEIRNFTANLFGGTLQLAGTVTNGQKPGYSLTGSLEEAEAKQVCGYLAMRCSGGPIGVNGRVDLSGFTAQDLTASATGSLHWDWARGAVQGRMGGTTAGLVPKDLARFSRWTGDGTIGQSVVTAEKSEVRQGRHTGSVPVVISFGDPPRVAFSPAKAAGKQ